MRKFREQISQLQIDPAQHQQIASTVHLISHCREIHRMFLFVCLPVGTRAGQAWCLISLAANFVPAARSRCGGADGATCEEMGARTAFDAFECRTCRRKTPADGGVSSAPRQLLCNTHGVAGLYTCDGKCEALHAPSCPHCKINTQCDTLLQGLAWLRLGQSNRTSLPSSC